jgi:large subunit ribosomal protein L15
MDISKIQVRERYKTPKRGGRGPGSGLGKTAGRGHKGAGQRSGKKLPYTGFRGGNLPFARKIPKRGFNAFSPKVYQLVNLSTIARKLADTAQIDPAVLKKANLIKDEKKPVKILARIPKEFSLKLTITADAFSKAAKKIIEENGGKTEYRRKMSPPGLTPGIPEQNTERRPHNPRREKPGSGATDV